MFFLQRFGPTVLELELLKDLDSVDYVVIFNEGHKEVVLRVLFILVTTRISWKYLYIYHCFSSELDLRVEIHWFDFCVEIEGES